MMKKLLVCQASKGRRERYGKLISVLFLWPHMYVKAHGSGQVTWCICITILSMELFAMIAIMVLLIIQVCEGPEERR